MSSAFLSTIVCPVSPVELFLSGNVTSQSLFHGICNNYALSLTNADDAEKTQSSPPSAFTSTNSDISRFKPRATCSYTALVQSLVLKVDCRADGDVLPLTALCWRRRSSCTAAPFRCGVLAWWRFGYHGVWKAPQAPKPRGRVSKTTL